MGFDLRDTGFHIVLSKDVPQMIREKIKGVVDRLEPKHRVVLVLATGVLLRTGVPSAEPVVVRHVEGLVHGFLSLRSPRAVIANGDLIQDTRGGRVTSGLVYTSKMDRCNEIAVFSQRGHLQFISDHLMQKGPAFDRQLDMMIDRATGHVVVRYKNAHVEEKVEDERISRFQYLSTVLSTRCPLQSF